MNCCIENLTPAFAQNNTVVVFETSAKFVPYLSVAIGSIIANSTVENNYDIIILSSELGSYEEASLVELGRSYSNVSVRVFNPRSLVKRYLDEATHYYLEINYYRLALPWILSKYEKAINLGADLIVNKDIALLYGQELSPDSYIGGVIDLGYLGRLNLDIAKSELALSDEKSYVNADVLLINLKKIREDYNIEEVMELWQRYRFRCAEQDVFNKLFDGHIEHLDMRWNVFPENMSSIRDINYAPQELQRVWRQANKDPFIIHYSAEPKPWACPIVGYSELWWEHAKHSPYYFQLLKEVADVTKYERKQKIQHIQDVIVPLHKRNNAIWKMIKNIRTFRKRGHLNCFGMYTEDRRRAKLPVNYGKSNQ